MWPNRDLGRLQSKQAANVLIWEPWHLKPKVSLDITWTHTSEARQNAPKVSITKTHVLYSTVQNKRLVKKNVPFRVLYLPKCRTRVTSLNCVLIIFDISRDSLELFLAFFIQTSIYSWSDWRNCHFSLLAEYCQWSIFQLANHKFYSHFASMA